MTAQAPDKLHYQKQDHAIIGIKGDKLPTPETFGLSVSMWSTGCYRGFIATYGVKDQELFLTTLHIGRLAQGMEWEKINGIEPTTVFRTGYSSRSEGEVTWEDGKKYSDLNVPTGFTGGILIGEGFIQSLYVHMGFGKPYQYEQVHELLFHEGTLINEIDHSEKAKQWREAVLQQQEDQTRHIREMRDAGLSQEEISQQLSQTSSNDEMLKGIGWRFSLDYDQWF